MGMPGRKYSAGSGYRYGFNGKENDNEVKGEGNSLDYGERTYDPRIGRWFSVDKYYYKYRSVSPYVFALNSPIVNLDNVGDSVWTTISVTTKTDENGFTYQIITESLHVTMKVLDVSDQPFNMVEFIDKLKGEITEKLKKQSKEGGGSGQLKDPRSKFVFEIGKIEIEKVTTMNEVRSSDHLMVIVDDINPGPFWSGSPIGIATLNGKISYVKNGWFTSSGKAARIGFHEFLHNLGLLDMYSPYMSEDVAKTLDPSYTTNVMYSGAPENGHLTIEQVNTVWNNLYSGVLNAGDNSEVVQKDESNGLTSTSSPRKPYTSSVKKGEKIPARIDSSKL